MLVADLIKELEKYRSHSIHINHNGRLEYIVKEGLSIQIYDDAEILVLSTNPAENKGLLPSFITGQKLK